MKIAIVSGYFNPLHVGHLRMIQEARGLAEMLVVVVNNDAQQVLKKGKIISPEGERLEIVRALATVDLAFIAPDADASVAQSLRRLRRDYPEDELIFCNGGDRGKPEEILDYDVCVELNIGLRFGVGGREKADSSTRINAALGV